MIFFMGLMVILLDLMVISWDLYNGILLFDFMVISRDLMVFLCDFIVISWD